MLFAQTAAIAVALAPGALAHGYIKQWGVKGSTLATAQKTDLASSSFRAVSDNTGWVGSDFLTNKAITCGAKTTPGGTTAAPSGVFFSAADQSAGQELAVSAGDTIELVISGNPGDGWPHRQGHVQTYLGSCGGDCTNFDASTAEFSKIQSEVNGIQNTLIPAYDSGVDGNRYDVTLPDDVDAGSYIFRFELIAFGQSSSAEGNQDQYYPFCGQIKVGSGASKRRLLKRAGETVTFPGAYQNGNIDSSTVPGPDVASAIASSGSSSSTSSSNSTSKSTSSKSTSSTASSASSSSSAVESGLTLASTAPQCATMCLQVKISELVSLASSCTSTDASCMCSTNTFMTAFANCARDNCDGDEDAAIAALDAACGSSEKKRDVAGLKGAQRKRSRMARDTKGIGASSVRGATKRATKKRLHGMQKMKRSAVLASSGGKGRH